MVEMREMVSDISNQITIKGNNNDVHDINMFINNRSFRDILKQVFDEIEEIIVYADKELISEEDSLHLEEIVTCLKERMFDVNITPLVISFVNQMKASIPSLEDAPRLNSLVIFLIIISFYQGRYSIQKEGEFYKIKVNLADKECDFSLYNLSETNKKLLKMVGPIVIKYLMQKGYSPTANSKVLLCGTKFNCTKQCLRDNAILNIIIDNFTDVEKYERKDPDFFTGLKKDPHLTCGNCLANSIYKYQKAAEIIEVIFGGD